MQQDRQFVQSVSIFEYMFVRRTTRVWTRRVLVVEADKSAVVTAGAKESREEETRLAQIALPLVVGKEFKVSPLGERDSPLKNLSPQLLLRLQHRDHVMEGGSCDGRMQLLTLVAHLADEFVVREDREPAEEGVVGNTDSSDRKPICGSKVDCLGKVGSLIVTCVVRARESYHKLP
jgi:hypothetical protein